MAFDLTEEQRQELHKAAGGPLHLTDPDTREGYVLLPERVYERLRTLLDEDSESSPTDAYPLVDETFREGWDDPKMAEYDHYEEQRERRSCS